MKIVWSQPALDSLSDVLDYSVEYFGTRVAAKTENAIFSAVEILGTYPLMGFIIQDISSESRIYRRKSISKYLSVIYRVEDDTIYIMFVWDSRRSLHNVFYFFNTL